MQRVAAGLRGGGLRPLAIRERAARRAPRAGWSTRSRCWRSGGTRTAARARCGCARPRIGDDKDRVLVRSSGEHTYFASDIAYHQDKRERGYERQIDVWGADHHGYVARMKAAYEALGGDPGHLEMVIMQLVHLVRRGERAQMSKRAGEFVTLDDLVEEIGVDAARWFLLSRSHDTTIDLDLDLARKQSPARTPCTTCSTRTRGSPRCWRRRASGGGGAGGGDRGEVAAAAVAAVTAAGRGRGPGEAAAPLRASADQAAAGVPRRGGGGRATPRAAPDRGVRAGGGAGLHGVLPRLPRRGRRAAGAGVASGSRCAWRRAARSRAAWRTSWGWARRGRCRPRCALEVAARGARSVEARHVRLQARGIGGRQG